MDELKPCPFCGGTAVPNSKQPERVNCLHPGCYMGEPWREYGLLPENWNTRPIEDALRAELEAARAEIADLRDLDDLDEAERPIAEAEYNDLKRELAQARAELASTIELAIGQSDYITFQAQGISNLNNTNAALRAELAALKAAREWVPVSDRLPKHPNWVWVCDIYNNVFPGIHYRGEWREYLGENDGVEFDIAYWQEMVMPTPPPEA